MWVCLFYLSSMWLRWDYTGYTPGQLSPWGVQKDEAPTVPAQQHIHEYALLFSSHHNTRNYAVVISVSLSLGFLFHPGVQSVVCVYKETFVPFVWCDDSFWLLMKLLCWLWRPCSAAHMVPWCPRARVGNYCEDRTKLKVYSLTLYNKNRVVYFSWCRWQCGIVLYCDDYT